MFPLGRIAQHDRTARFVEEVDTEFLDVACVKADRQSVCAGIADFVVRDESWSELVLQDVHASSPLIRAFMDAGKAAGLPRLVGSESGYEVCVLPGGFDEFRRGLSSSARRRMFGGRKKLEKQGAIEVEQEFNLYIPNAFSPDGDGVNDLFRAEGTGIREFTMRVYDRWGELVFETEDITKAWDGAFKGGLATPGVYVVQVRVKAMIGEAYDRMGHVTLVR